MKHSKTLETVALGLTIVTFVTLSWVLHRTLQMRTHCLNSSFLSYVKLEDRLFNNCTFESRLNLDSLWHPATYAQMQTLRRLEKIDQLKNVIPARRPNVALEIVDREPRVFELVHGYTRLGKDWLEDETQLHRALIMSVLHQEMPQSFHSHFQLEVITDFLLASAFGEDQWTSAEGEFSFLRDVQFPSSSPEFADYCKSPFRSLAHHFLCQLEKPDSEDLQSTVWGFRPLLASALWRVYEKLPLAQKLAFQQKLAMGLDLPVIPAVRDQSVNALVVWFQQTLNQHLEALGVNQSPEGQLATRRAIKELQVEAPTHWELTFDLTRAPAWKEIVEQLRKRSRFNRKERVLIFTPEGERVLPSGIQVAWAANDVQSQKHVLVACRWPKADEAVNIRARNLVAKQSCGKLTEAFW